MKYLRPAGAGQELGAQTRLSQMPSALPLLPLPLLPLPLLARLILAQLILALSLLALAPGAGAQTPPPAAARVLPAPAPLALIAAPSKAHARLTVTSPGFAPGAPIPEANSGYGANTFPGLSWSGAPKRTKSFVVLIQDSDPPRAELMTIVHWTLFNIPASVTALAPGMVAAPASAREGANIRGPQGAYFGPRPPAGASAHHYHFQVFALDRRLALAHGAPYAAIIGAMKGHVLASGEIVGTYRTAAPSTGATSPTAPTRAP